MINERDSTHWIGQCDRCLLATPLIDATTDADAAKAMMVGGWAFINKMTFCPGCRDLRLASSVGARQRQANAAKREASPSVRR